MLHRIELHSRVLQTTSPVSVYIPDCGQERYPVVYLFRGDGNEWLDVGRDGTRRGRNAITVLDDLLHKGYIPPVALVFPTTANSARGVFAGGFDFFSPPVPAVANIGTGKFEEFALHELIPEIESRFPIGGSAGLRALDGFSLGGLISFVLALKHPGRFVAVGSYDAAFLYWNHDHPRGCSHPENDLRLDLFPYWFGAPPDLDHFRASNPADIVFHAAGERLAALRALPMYLHNACDRTPNANQWRVERFVEMLAHVGIENGFANSLLDPHARHDWYWADEHLYHVLPRLCGHFRSSREL